MKKTAMPPWIVRLTAICTLLAAFSVACDAAAPAGRLGKTVIPTHYRIELSIDPSRERFSGTVAIDVTLTESVDEIWLHGKNLEVSEVFLADSQSRRFDASYAEKLESGVALVKLSSAAASGPATLHFTYSAPFNTSTNALFKVGRGGKFYAATQFQPIAARQVFPSFDEPGFKVPFDLSVIARKGDIVVTTTPETSARELPGGEVLHVFQRTRPLPTYLIAFAVGPYDVADFGRIPANVVRDREVALRGIVAQGLGDKMKYALQNTAGLLSALEVYFGTPYPYEKLDLIAVPESFGGAMENVGAITYDEYLMLMDENSALDQRRDYAAIHAHELAHMWFGNLVTPEWWNDIWLNESFASWMQHKAAAAFWPDGEFDRETLKGALGAMANDSLASAREIREPIDDNDRITSAFDTITYQKGAGVLAMLERYVGEQSFQAGVRLHMKRHADGTATAEDFIDSVAEGADRAEIEKAFHSFIGQPGVPLVSVELNCSDTTAPRLELRQARYAPLGSTIRTSESQWQIPFCVSYQQNGASGNTCALLHDREQTITLTATGCPTALHPNADGAGYYRFTLDAAGWQDLIGHAKTLRPAEALVLADSLDAGLRAGVVPVKLYISGLAALLDHGAWDAATAATGYLESITEILDEGQQRQIEPALQKMATPRFASLTDADDAGSILLHKNLQRFLIVVARDQALRKPLAAQAARTIGLGGAADWSATPAGELETVLSVGVQDLGEPFFDRLLELASTSEDPAIREAAIGALARVEDPVLVRKLQAAVLSRQFKGVEMLTVVFRQINRPATTEQTFAWLKENDDAVIAMIPEVFRSNIFPAFGGAFCSDERADEWQAFVQSHAGALPGHERDLAQTIESIHLCAALRRSRAADLLAAFSFY